MHHSYLFSCASRKAQHSPGVLPCTPHQIPLPIARRKGVGSLRQLRDQPVQQDDRSFPSIPKYSKPRTPTRAPEKPSLVINDANRARTQRYIQSGKIIHQIISLVHRNAVSLSGARPQNRCSPITHAVGRECQLTFILSRRRQVPLQAI